MPSAADPAAFSFFLLVRTVPAFLRVLEWCGVVFVHAYMLFSRSGPRCHCRAVRYRTQGVCTFLGFGFDRTNDALRIPAVATFGTEERLVVFVCLFVCLFGTKAVRYYCQ